jgi:hypothetical protein
MGSKGQPRIIFFPCHTPETTIFRDPTERRLSPTVERDIRRLYTEGLHFPTPQPTSQGEFRPSPPNRILPLGMDEDGLARLYAAAAYLLKKPSERGLWPAHALPLLNKIHDDLMKDYDPSIVDN